MRRLELSAAARTDLADIWRYTDARWGRAQARRYGDRIDGAMTALAGAQESGQPMPVAGYRCLRVASHLVCYRETDEAIRVARVLHVRMDIARHLPG